MIAITSFMDAPFDCPWSPMPLGDSNAVPRAGAPNQRHDSVRRIGGGRHDGAASGAKTCGRYAYRMISKLRDDAFIGSMGLDAGACLGGRAAPHSGNTRCIDG